MDRDGFVKLAVLAFGLIVASFIVRGFGRLLVGLDVAEIAQAPLLLSGFGLVVYLFVRATLDWIGLWSIEAADGSDA